MSRAVPGVVIGCSVTSTYCVPPLVPTRSDLSDTVAFWRSALANAECTAPLRPSRAMAKMFRLALPAAGSRYFPVLPLIYAMSPFSLSSTAGGQWCSRSWASVSACRLGADIGEGSLSVIAPVATVMEPRD